WPWPRQIHAAIIQFCRQSEVKALAFDILYTEFSVHGVDDDLALGAAIADFPNFVSTIFLSDTKGKADWPEDFPPPVFEISGLKSWLDNSENEHILFQRAVMPIPEVAQNADILGNVTLTADFDGIYRRIKLFSLFDNKLFPTLGLGLYLSAHRDAHLEIDRGRLLIDEQAIPLDKNGNAILRYRGPSQTHKFYTAGQILQALFRQINSEEATETDKAIAADLRGKYVLFGYAAPGLFDLRPAPVDSVYPGVEINATVLDNLLSEDFIVPVPLWFTVFLLLGLSLGCGILASLFSKAVENVLIGIVFLALPFLFVSLAYLKGFWLLFALQETAAGLTILASLVINYATEGRQKRFIKNAFQQYLSPAVIEQLLEHPEHLKLGGELRQLSIFFSDI
ncbi:MAG: CHASE2 domain-containing protein, partial [bacterium]|nr:CHASE2 domain-containing protein [bacterium]